MPLLERQAAHFRAQCDGPCNGYQTAEVCGKRDTGAVARKAAIDSLRKAGWHVDGLGSPKERWYCPTCGKRKNNL